MKKDQDVLLYGGLAALAFFMVGFTIKADFIMNAGIFIMLQVLWVNEIAKRAEERKRRKANRAKELEL